MTSRKPFSVRLRTVGEALAAFPSLKEWEPAVFDADLLILAAGFEARTAAFPFKLVELEQPEIALTLVGRYQTNPEDNTKQYSQILPLLEKLTKEIVEVDADVPEEILRAILELKKTRSFRRVLFDISGASANFIFSVIGALAQTCPDIELSVLYAEAATYNQSHNADEIPPTPELPESGVASVWNNAIFQGRHQDTAGSHIIAFPSLYLSRLARCLNFCGEAVESLAERNVHWVLPSTNHPDHQWRRAKTIAVVRQLVATPSGEPDAICSLGQESQVDCDVLSAGQAAKIILDEAEARPGQNLFLVHMGSKVQAVGAALALSARKEISLVYARPERFIPENYTDGIGAMHLLRFSSLGEAVHELAMAGQMVVVCGDGSEEY